MTLAERLKNEGRKKGIKQGERDKAIEIAKNLKKLNVSIDTIIQSTGLTKEELEEIFKANEENESK